MHRDYAYIHGRKNDEVFTCMNNSKCFMRMYIIFLKGVLFQTLDLELRTQLNNHLTRKCLQVRVSFSTGVSVRGGMSG
jgi:hypothetical protein